MSQLLTKQTQMGKHLLFTVFRIFNPPYRISKLFLAVNPTANTDIFLHISQVCKYISEWDFRNNYSTWMNMPCSYLNSLTFGAKTFSRKLYIHNLCADLQRILLFFYPGINFSEKKTLTMQKNLSFCIHYE